MFLPLGNSTIEPHSQFHHEPTTRGTVNIVTTCLSTLILCVWSAVHMNIPGTRDSSRIQIVRRVAWLLCALFAPEIVAFVAWGQRQQAKAILRTWYETFAPPPESEQLSTPLGNTSAMLEDLDIETLSSPPDSLKRIGVMRKIWLYTQSHFLSPLHSFAKEGKRRWKLFICREKHAGRSETPQLSAGLIPWTMVHAHFVAMGGLALPTKFGSESGPRSPFWPEKESSPVLTEAGFKYLCQVHPKLVPNMSEGDIRNKSKTGGLIKAWTCMQALWFVLQCLTRLGTDLPMSLLEFITLGHTVCAVVIYIAWWDKPYDTSSPQVITGRHACDLAAAASMRHMYTELEGNPPIYASDGGRLLPNLQTEGRIFHYIDTQCGVSCVPGGPYTLPYPSNSHYAKEAGEFFTVTERSMVPETKLRLCQPGFVKLGQLTHERFKMASRYLDRYKRVWPSHALLSARRIEIHDIPVGHECSQWSERSDLMMCAGLLIATSIYGAFHALAWNAPFPSSLNRLLWRVSALLPIGFGNLSVLLSLTEWGAKLAESFPITLATVGSPAYLIYMASRCYLVIEPFFALSHSPRGVYEVVPWTSYFPHFG